MEGWIRLHRKIAEWEWFDNANMVQLFIYLLAKANATNKTWQGISINRGQVVCSQQAITTNLGMQRQTLRTCLKKLERTGEITIKSTKRFTLITICKYDDYQYVDGGSQPTTNQEVTNNQPTTNHNVRIQKERIERKNSSLRSEFSKAGPATHTREGEAGTDEKSQGVVSTEAEQGGSAEAAEGAPNAPQPEAVMELFNAAVRDKRIPKIAKMTERRASAIHARVSEYGSEAIATVIAKAATSVFLNGGGAKQFVATFDWIFLPNNFPKILEGNFDNPPTPTTTTSPTTTPTPTTTAHGTPQGITTHRTAEAGRAERENEWLSHAMARLREGTDREATANPFELADG